MKRLKWLLLLVLALCALTGGALAADRYTLYGVTIGQGEVSVTLEAEADCLLMVAVYDSSGAMRTIQGKNISGNENYQIISVPFSDETLVNGYAKAFLLGNDTLSPLCSGYDSNTDGNVFAILYDDGEMVFQHGDTPEEERIITKVYPTDLNGYTQRTVPWDNRCDAIIKVRFADIISPTRTAFWFQKCNNLVEFENINNLDTYNVTSMLMMFTGCSKLTALDLSSFDTRNVKNMSNMFWGCFELTDLNISHFDTSRVTLMTQMFRSCGNLSSLDVTGFNTTNVKDMFGMFAGCKKLPALNVSSFDTSQVERMGSMFTECDGLTQIDISSFNTINVLDMDYMFSGCAELSKIEVSSSFSIERIIESRSPSDHMFSNCTSLVGGANTVYDENHTDAEYARIDGGPDAPGYFTLKAA